MLRILKPPMTWTHLRCIKQTLASYRQCNYTTLNTDTASVFKCLKGPSFLGTGSKFQSQRYLHNGQGSSIGLCCVSRSEKQTQPSTLCMFQNCTNQSGLTLTFQNGLKPVQTLKGISVSHTSIRNLSKSKQLQPVPSKVGFSFLTLKSLLSCPFPFMMYGLGGLIPFAAAPYYLYNVDIFYPFVASAQLAYGACILSFLGGVSWGSALTKEKNTLNSLRYSILLPLVGWSSVLIHPNPLSFVVLISGVAYAGYVDTQFQPYPDWFKTLRFMLSSVVVMCLFATLTLSLIKPHEKKSIQ